MYMYMYTEENIRIMCSAGDETQERVHASQSHTELYLQERGKVLINVIIL